MIAVKNNPNSFQNVGKNLRDDDGIFKLAIQQKEKNLKCTSERKRKINIQS